MSRHLTVPLLFLAAISLAGCDLYFSDRYDDDDDYYCDDQGCYWCDDWGCYPDGGSGGGSWSCTSDDGCPVGSYCDETWGECVGSYQCATDAECGAGMECDEARGTCQPLPCTADEDCLEGCYCDEEAGVCVETSTCDASCAPGYECDEQRNTCEPTDDEPVLCQAEVTCDSLPPACPDGSSPGIQEGCWTGECVDDADCPDGAPVECEDHDTEAECAADDACESIFRGLNCTSPTGASCTSGDANCTCESFAFYTCAPVSP